MDTLTFKWVPQWILYDIKHKVIKQTKLTNLLLQYLTHKPGDNTRDNTLNI